MPGESAVENGDLNIVDISDVRKRIDQIDKELVEMLNQRAECALEIGQMKQKGDRSIFAPEREVQVLSGVLKNNKGPLSDKTMGAIFREVISACRALEKPISVAYFGLPGQLHPYRKHSQVW